MSTNLTYKADIIGASASLLCLIHCLATPFVFFIKTSSSLCCSETPIWWQSIDYIFLTVAFFAVVYILGSNKTKKWYHPGRSGLISLGSINGPELAYFGEIHPSIVKKLELRTDNVLGFEIFLDNIPESRKKIRETKPQFIVSDYQRVVRDFAFVIDEKYSSGEIINLVKEIDKKLIKEVRIFKMHFFLITI